MAKLVDAYDLKSYLAGCWFKSSYKYIYYKYISISKSTKRRSMRKYVNRRLSSMQKKQIYFKRQNWSYNFLLLNVLQPKTNFNLFIKHTTILLIL